MKSFRDIRVIPVVLIAIFGLAVLKVAGLVIDGPFAETKEQLLGFYVVDCADEEAAVQAARELRRVNPSAVYEIRPLMLYLPGAPFPVTAATAERDPA